MRQDRNGVKYYSLKDALGILGISRTTFEKRIREQGIMRWKPRKERSFYYRVEDIEALKTDDDIFLPMPPDKKGDGPPNGSEQAD